MEYKTGSLVSFRDRNWVLLPESDDRLLKLKPLGGHDLETLRILRDLHEGEISSASLAYPDANDLGNFESGRLLYDAARLALRTGAGPFRSFGKLSVRPRPYQIVPLIMALRQSVVRLLIADDVGIGKTVEALLILKELLERGIIERFAVLCPPHLCDQWKMELEEKFGIQSEIVSSATAGKLDRTYHGDEHHFKKLPAMVISIDYLKTERYRTIFTDNCPEMVIVDEAHNAAAADADNSTQQLRHALVKKISEREGQHLILLTATPHSGKEGAFQSLLGLLKKEFESYVLSELDGRSREVNAVARHFIQRRRKDILPWLSRNDFPERVSEELPYVPHSTYLDVMAKTRALSKSYISAKQGSRGRVLMRQWAMLSLLRGIASSPAAGALMLRNKVTQQEELEDEQVDAIRNHLETEVVDEGLGVLDHEIIEAPELSKHLSSEFRKLANELEGLGTLDHDLKARHLLQKLESLIKEGFKPIVFCRFIRSAEYLQELLGPKLSKRFGSDFGSVAVTSTLNDEQRRERIAQLCQDSDTRVLFATDCLSEGINLQEHFNAVIHYDLPWNPNRLEQREGRVDRFGQSSELVKAVTMTGDHTMDRAILNVLIRKIHEIRAAIGVTIQVPNSKSLIESMSDEVFGDQEVQLDLALDDKRSGNARRELDTQLERTKSREMQTRSIFKQLRIDPNEIEPDLVDSDQVLGDPAAVEAFIRRALRYTQARVIREEPFTIEKSLMPAHLWHPLSKTQEKAKLAFEAPYPEGHAYIGRTHPFVERMSNFLIKSAFEHSEAVPVRRASVLSMKGVRTRTAIVLFRIRNVIASRAKNHEMVAEELYLWGYEGLLSDEQVLSPEACHTFLTTAQATMELSLQAKADTLNDVVSELREHPAILDEITRSRTKILIDAHARHSKSLGEDDYIGVEPVLPPDPIAIYILQPDLTGVLP